MEFKIYTKSKDCEQFTIKNISGDIIETSFYMNHDCGQICFSYRGKDPMNFRSESLCFDRNSVTYVTVNDNEKFIIKNRKDMIHFYKFLTSFDLNKFIKDFKSFEKEHNMKEDF